MQQVRGSHVFVVEEACSNSGICDAIAMYLQESNTFCKVHSLDLGNDFIPHGAMKSLYQRSGLDSDSITEYISEVLRHED